MKALRVYTILIHVLGNVCLKVHKYAYIYVHLYAVMHTHTKYTHKYIHTHNIKVFQLVSSNKR